MDTDTLYLAGMIYGEGASTDYDTMKLIGSTAINRLKSGRTKEFGSNMAEVLRKGYYAVSNPNKPYKHIMEGKFPDEASTEKYKQALVIAGGLMRGTIEPDKGLFYFTPKEETKLRKTPKVFDFKQVSEVNKVGGYSVYDYK
jgi:hypothetical protein